MEIPINIKVDNKGEIFIDKNSSINRTRHISVRYHVIIELIRDGTIVVIFIMKDKKMVDIFTNNSYHLTFDNN